MRNKAIDTILQQERKYFFNFENLLEPNDIYIQLELLFANDLLQKLEAIKTLIVNRNSNIFQDKTYYIEIVSKELYKMLFILEIRKAYKWNITLTIDKNFDIEKVINEMKVYLAILNHLKNLGYGK